MNDVPSFCHDALPLYSVYILCERLSDICGTDEASNRAAFQRHFDQELLHYASMTVISLVDQYGKEKVISDAFLSHILTLDYPRLSYITYDFHEYW